LVCISSCAATPRASLGPAVIRSSDLDDEGYNIRRPEPLTAEDSLTGHRIGRPKETLQEKFLENTERSLADGQLDVTAEVLLSRTAMGRARQPPGSDQKGVGKPKVGRSRLATSKPVLKAKRLWFQRLKLYVINCFQRLLSISTCVVTRRGASWCHAWR